MSDALQIQSRLAAMQDAFEGAPLPEGGYELPPDGDYQAVVERFDFFEANSNGHLFLKTEMRVSSGQHQGAYASTIHDVEDPDKLGWLKKHLTMLGVQDGPLGTLTERLEPVAGAAVEIRVKTGPGKNSDGIPYRNVYINKRIGAVPVGGAKPTASTKKPSDDDIPF